MPQYTAIVVAIVVVAIVVGAIVVVAIVVGTLRGFRTSDATRGQSPTLRYYCRRNPERVPNLRRYARAKPDAALLLSSEP